MENLYTQNFDTVNSSILNLGITSVVLFLLPIVIAVLWKKQCGRTVSLAPLFIGAAGFLISARVLELGVHMVCIVADNPISKYINGHTPVYVIYGIFMAGIFEEVGRYVIIRFLMKKNKTRENFVMYGIGHGGIEVWSITLLSSLTLLAFAVLVKYQGIESALQLMGISKDVPEDLVSTVVDTLTTATNYGIVMAGLCVFERICAMTVHIAFTVIVSYGVEKKQNKYLLAAILSHAIVDTFPALYQRGVVTLPVTEVWCLFCSIVLSVAAFHLYQKSFENRSRQTE